MIDAIGQYIHFFQRYAVHWWGRRSPGELLVLLFVIAMLSAVWRARAEERSHRRDTGNNEAIGRVRDA